MKSFQERIKERAIAQWGQNWETELVRAYAHLESLETNREIKANQRRSQILKIAHGGNCYLDTALRLGRCVGVSFKLTFEETVS